MTTDNESDEALGVEPGGMRYWLTPGQVARRLGWSDDSIRRHMVTVDEHRTTGQGVPSIELGARKYVPRWWLRKVLEEAGYAATVPE